MTSNHPFLLMELVELPAATRSPAFLMGAIIVAGWSIVSLPYPLCFVGFGFGGVLLSLAWIDQKSLLLPDLLTLPLGLAGLAVSFTVNPARFSDQVIGLIAGFAGMALLAWLYRIVRRREGLGGGDAKLLGALGAWVGWQGLPTVLMLAALTGLFAVGIQRLRGRPLHSDRPLPFGPWLCLGGWLVWLYGPLIPS
jgi:leader peptidase (prepilin peptidase)/N-methyltransferase